MRWSVSIRRFTEAALYAGMEGGRTASSSRLIKAL
jgi:hypothetical protein